MKATLKLNWLCVLTLLAFGCAESTNGGGGTEIDDPAAQMAAVAGVEQVGDFEGFKSDVEDPAATAAVFTVYGSLNAMLAPALEGLGAGLGGLEQKAVHLQAGSVTVNGDTINFNGFGVSGVGGIGGTVSLDGAITLTPTLITGNLNYAVSIEGVPGAPATTLDATYNDVAIDADGCPTGGSINAAFTAAGLASVNVTATFGPECDDVTLTQ